MNGDKDIPVGYHLQLAHVTDICSVEVLTGPLQVRISCSIGILGYFSSFGGGALFSLCAILTLNAADYSAHVRSS